MPGSEKGKHLMGELSRALPARQEPTIFTFPDTGQPVRTVAVNAEPWWIASDVCAVLDIANVGNVLARLDDDDVSSIRLADGTPGNPNRAIVNEPGLYELVIRSDRPQAKAFRRWITHDVIPSIRKTGAYVTALADPLDEIEAANSRASQAVAIARQERARAELAETKAAELEPAAAAWDTLASTGADYSAREAAYILRRDQAIDTGERKLLTKIREWRMVDHADRPYYDHRTHLVLRPQSYTDASGAERDAKPQIRITYAGLKYLHKRLGGTGRIQEHVNAALEAAEVNR